MKTFETEIHEKPITATHYRDECNEYEFSWVKFNNNSMFVWDDTYWDEVEDDNFEFSVKPIKTAALENQMNIDNLATQTPEEKEALDTMAGISREHLMKMINQQSEIIKELSEKLNTSESPNGSNEIIKPLWAKWSIGDSVTKTKGSSWTGKVVGYYQTDLTSKGYAVESETEKGSVQIYPEAALCSVETEAGRVERERLEAAYDLFCVWSDGATPCSFDVFVNGTIGNSKRRFLAIVDKTNYRKESN
jgi:dihydrofolate reductase (trimethoprim resistance protein)